MPKIDMDKIKQIAAAYCEAMQHTDPANLDAMEAHVHELVREHGRAMGLPEDEIARIEQESKKRPISRSPTR